MGKASDEPQDTPLPEEEENHSRMKRLSRLWHNRRDLADDTREVLSAVLETSDKAKTEMIRMVAREVRAYLGELKLKEDLLDLATSHSLEVHVSLNLKPLVDAPAPPADDEEKR